MAISFTYDASDLKVVQNVNSLEWFVFDLNEGDVISDGFVSADAAQVELESWLA